MITGSAYSKLKSIRAECQVRGGVSSTSCRDGDSRDVDAGTLRYRFHCVMHPIQHISYWAFGYNKEEESRPRIEKGDFIFAARDARLARERASLPNHGEMYE